MNIDKFEDIRPYKDEEIAPAMERIVANPLLENISSYLFPGRDSSELKQLLTSCKTIDDFQERVMSFVVSKILKDTAKKVTFDGVGHYRNDKRYLIISDHRDIVLDPAIIQLLLYRNGLNTTEIAVGDNLITSSFIEDLTRSNKMIKVVRSTNPRELYTSSQKLSSYIRQNVSSNSSSVWIAQRNGRTKDGRDMTEQGLLKMLDMSGSGDFVKDFTEINIMPASISYEFEPCDLLKCVEVYISKRRKYVKSKNEDLNSILTGIMQFKGNIHIQFTEPISQQEVEEAAKLDKNERFKYLASCIDKRVYSTYKLWPNNYVAYDILNNTNRFENEYTPADKKSFVEYMNFKLSSAEGDIKELEDIFLHIYANPVLSRLEVTE